MQGSQAHRQNFSLAAEAGGGGVGLLAKRLYIKFMFEFKNCVIKIMS
jgi:hypothetical protein